MVRSRSLQKPQPGGTERDKDDRRLRQDMRTAMRLYANEFQAADRGSDGMLDIVEFGFLVSDRTGKEYSAGILNTILKTMTGGASAISFENYFAFCLFDMSRSLGKPELVFKHYDNENSGQCPVDDFEHVMEKFGFEALMPHLRRKVHVVTADGREVMDYRRLIREMHSEVLSRSGSMRLVRALARQAKSEMAAVPNSCARRSSCVLASATGGAVEQTLAAMLRENREQVCLS